MTAQHTPADDSASLARVPKRREPKAVRKEKYRPHNPSNRTRLGGLRVYDPLEWERQVREALKKVDYNVTEAAKLLEVSRPQMFRWLTDPRFADIKRLPPGPKRKPDA